MRQTYPLGTLCVPTFVSCLDRRHENRAAVPSKQIRHHALEGGALRAGACAPLLHTPSCPHTVQGSECSGPCHEALSPVLDLAHPAGPVSRGGTEVHPGYSTAAQAEGNPGPQGPASGGPPDAALCPTLGNLVSRVGRAPWACPFIFATMPRQIPCAPLRAQGGSGSWAAGPAPSTS